VLHGYVDANETLPIRNVETPKRGSDSNGSERRPFVDRRRFAQEPYQDFIPFGPSGAS
jgi:hypothetical protein